MGNKESKKWTRVRVEKTYRIGVNGNIPPRDSPVPDMVLIKYCTKLAVVRVSLTLPNPKFKKTHFHLTDRSNSKRPYWKKIRWFNVIQM